jgi:hypothetical protein
VRNPAALVRSALAALLAAALAPGILALLLRLSPAIELKLGPGDRDYAHGFGERFRFDGERRWRGLEGPGRATLPLRLGGGGTLEVLARAAGSSPALLTVRFDDGTSASATVPNSGEATSLRFQVAGSRIRTHVRLRTEGGPLQVSSLRWRSTSLLPDRSLALAAALLGALSSLAFAVAGFRARGSLLGVALIVGALFVLSSFDGFAAIHLVRRLAWAAGLGVVLVGIARLAARDSAPVFRALLYGALLIKSGLLFHPDFHFYDWPIHETLLELLYHRGPLDFRSRLVDYQLAHNVGVAPVGGEARAFPYPVLFYYVAHAGNRLHHAPELWLKLTVSLFAALALLPLGYLARRLTPSPNADSFAAVAYLLVPSLARSLLLLELSASAGCFFDLLAVAALAALNVKLEGIPRFALAALAMAASLAAYTAGFVHLGLLVGAALGLSVVERPFGRFLTAGSWVAGDALRLALAGILALGLALFAYHPKAVAALATAVLPQGVESPSDDASPPADLVGSAFARARTFLGLPLIALGAIGLGLRLGRMDPSPLRLLYAAWALSALAAYALRFVLIDLMQYQKELYWAAALLAIGAGGALSVLDSSGRRGRLAAGALLVVLGAAFAFAVPSLVEQFYRRYLFL